ncbi:DoxX family protein [Mucilaginibacter sp.]|uniref:DoxX family protein n=1 Tax=Mucilaginibacter sp. TaxID=1882438 RepID=UPI003D104F1B
MYKLKKISLFILIVGYLVAGANHFYNPGSYYKIIPPYIPFPKVMNVLAGFFEILFALMLIFAKTRALAAWGIILMLIAFVPVHVQMVIDAPFLLGGTIKISPMVAWIRLVVLQPLLILWAWWYTKSEGELMPFKTMGSSNNNV